jgi:RNA polymerase primary sigma factor
MKQLKIQKLITQRNSDSIGSYFSDISKIPLISAQEEYELFENILKGDQLAFNKVINSNLRFVISVAKQYQNQGLGLEDLISEGNIGLIKAAQKFDNKKGFKFISYAVWWIRQSIMQSIAENSRTIRLPNNHINAMNKIYKTSALLEQELEREPTIEELDNVLKDLDIKVRENYILSNSNKTISLDLPINDKEDTSLYEVIENKVSESPDEVFIKESFYSDIEKVLKRMPNNRQRIIICMYYGLIGYQPMTLEEIGEYCGLTRERVRQIKEIGIKYLRLRKNSKILKEHF